MKKLILIIISIILMAIISFCLLLNYKGTEIATDLIKKYFDTEVKIKFDFSYEANKSNVEIFIKNLDVKDLNNIKLASANKISFVINPINIFNNSFLINDINIDQPFINISKLKITAVSKKNTNRHFNIKEIQKYLRFKSIELQNGKVVLEANNLSYLWRINSFKTINKPNNSEIIIDSEFAGMKTDLSLSLTKNISGEKLLKINYSNLPIFDFTKNFQDNNLPFFNIFLKQKNPILINGGVKIYFAKNGDIKTGDLNIASGQILQDQRIENLNAKNLEITGLTCSLEVKENLSYILLKEFKISFDDNTSISTSFLLKQKPKYKNYFGNSIVYFGLNYDVKNIAVKNLSTLWPNLYEDKVRDWVVNNIHNGTVVDGKGGFNFGRNFFNTGKLEPSDINAELNIKDTDLIYYDNLPEIKKIDGSIIFSGAKLVSYAKSATINNTALSNTQIELPYDMDYLSLKGNTLGPIADFYNFIPASILKKMTDMKINLEEISSLAESKVDINIPIKNNLSTNDLKIDIETNANDVVISKEFSEFPFSKLFFKILSINNNTRITGKGTAREAELDLDFKTEDKEDNYDCVLNAKINNKAIKSLGGEGVLKLEEDDIIPLKLVIHKNSIDMTSDLSDTGLKLLLLGYEKEKKIKAHIQSVINFTENGNFTVKDFVYSGIKDKVIADVKSEDGIFIGNVFLKKLGASKNIEANFNNSNKTDMIAIKGETLDISNAMLQNYSKFSAEQKSSKNININIDNLILKNDEYFKKFILNFQSDASGYIKQLSLVSQIKQNNSVLVEIKDVNDQQQQIIISSDDAAAIFRGLGVYNNILGGELCARINKIKLNDSFNFEGALAIDNFYMTKQSFLTKLLLGLTSATGFVNSNKENAIFMNRFITKISFVDNVIDLNGLITGPSLRIVTAGDINLSKEKLDIKGSVIPSLYGLNMGIARIPIIGPLLSGDEEAIFSASFAVNGELNNPKISFNPFSLLPISFLKRIFNTK